MVGLGVGVAVGMLGDIVGDPAVTVGLLVGVGVGEKTLVVTAVVVWYATAVVGRQITKAVAPAAMVKEPGTVAWRDDDDDPHANFHPLMSTELPEVPVVPWE